MSKSPVSKSLISKRPTSANLAAIAALVGCTATFLLPSEASAFKRVVTAHVSIPAPHKVVSRPAFHPAQRRIAQTISHQNAPTRRPQFRAATVNFAHPAAHFPRLAKIQHIGGFPHLGGIGSHFPHAHGSAGNFPHPGSIGGQFPHAHNSAGNFPHPGSIGGHVPHNAGATTSAHKFSHSFSIGDIPVIGPAVGAATKTAGDLVTGKIQKVPGDIISGPGKVVTGTIGQLTPKPASTSEPKGSTTSDASGFTPAKPSMVQMALMLKHLQDVKAAQQATATQTPPVVITPPPATNTTTTKPGQVFCIVAPCPVLHPGSSTGKNPGGKHNNPVVINVGTGSAGGAIRPNRFPRRDAGNAGTSLPMPLGGTMQPSNQAPVFQAPVFQAPVYQASIYRASTYRATYQAPNYQAPTSQAPTSQASTSQASTSQAPALTPVNLPAPGSLGTHATATAPTPSVADTTPTAPAASSPMFVHVAFQKDVSATDMASFLKGYKVSIVDGPNADGLYELQLAEPLTPDVLTQMIESMKSQTSVVAMVAN